MAVSVFIACVGATTVNFKNLCHFPIELIKTEWGHQSVKECDLGALGGNCSKSYDRNPTTAIMNFKTVSPDDGRSSQDIDGLTVYLDGRRRYIDGRTVNLDGRRSVQMMDGHAGTSTNGPSIWMVDADIDGLNRHLDGQTRYIDVTNRQSDGDGQSQDDGRSIAGIVDERTVLIGMCRRRYIDRRPSIWMDGWDGRDPTVAEFSFNTAERVDLYDIRIMSGYKGIWRMPTMQIVSSNGGPTLTSSWNADVYLSPNDCNKTREVPTGGTFDVTFCAGDTASTAGRSLGISKLKALLHQI
ncbi:hypothetical protein BV898_19824 [Hypsibius exemplaris]|uniref:Uncharacterized protein n=1 Tax=Hypsibius exemplaris TaxID=2072580 RepID=A0A9X6NJR9_HYPEX|nr:hypothetical protein BV898_19824 [Hypsibius exemplaris]